MKKRVLGLDIGVASIGWAVVDLQEDVFERDEKSQSPRYRITDGEIVASGVRTFQQPIDRQRKSLALIRGEARRSRATIERHAERLRYFVKLAKEFGLISMDFKVDDLKVPKGFSFKEWDVWPLRVKVLDEKLSLFDIFRILYYIANHRGFYFPTKAEKLGLIDEVSKDSKKNAEDQKVKAGMKVLYDNFTNSDARTIGEYIFNNHNKKRNKKDDYTLAVRREDLENEVRKILNKQRGYYPILSLDFEERYIKEVLMYVHPLDNKKLQSMMGKCEFFPDLFCAPKTGYSSELFSFYNRLNNLYLVKNKQKIELNLTQREKIFQKALEKEKVTFADLRNLLLCDYQTVFNLCSYREDNPEYNKGVLFKKDKLSEIKKEDFNIYNKDTGEIDNLFELVFEKVNSYFVKYSQAKQIKYTYNDIRKFAKIENDVCFSKLEKDYIKPKNLIGDKKYYSQFEKDVFISLKGYHQIKKSMGDLFEQINTPEHLDTISEALVYFKTDEDRSKYLKENNIIDANLIDKILELNMNDLASFSKKALNKLNQLMAEGMLFNQAVEKVCFPVKEYEKKTFIEEYEGFYGKNPAVARILGQCRKVVNAITREYGSKYPIDVIHIELATDVANSKKRVQDIRSGQDRYKAQKERAIERCNQLGINPECGANLLRFRLAEEQDFKCIYSGMPIFTGEKQDTPVGCVNIMDCEIDHVIPFSRSFNDSLNNKVLCTATANQEKRNQLPFEWIGDDAEKWECFKERVIRSNLIPYTKKSNLMRQTFNEDDKDKFISRNLNDTRYATRHVAEYLRKYYDFSKSNNKEIKDVNRIQVRGGGITAKLRYMWGLKKDRDENNLHHAMDAIVVACASMGHVHFICNVMREKECGKIVKVNLKPWQSIQEDVNDSLKNIFVSRMPRRGATGEVHAAIINPLNPKHKNYDEKKLKSGMEIRDGFAANGNMFRTDVFSKKNKKGKEEFYLVPIYLSAIGQTKLPNKAIVNGKSEADWIEIDDTYTFKFSMFMDDLIKTTKNNVEVFGYFKGTDRDSGRISLLSHDCSSDAERVGTKTLDKIQKYQVDVLGKYVEVKKEKRLPLDLKNNKKGE